VHYLAVAPYTIQRSQRTAAKDILLRPGWADVYLIVRCEVVSDAITVVDHVQLHFRHFRPVGADVSGVGAILIAKWNNDQLLRHSVADALPLWRFRELIVNRLQRARYCAVATLHSDIQRTGFIIEQQRFDEV